MFPIWIRLDIAAMSASTTITREQKGNRRAIGFSVHPSKDEELRLATGQVFCHPRRYLMEHKGAPKADGHLQIIESQMDAERPWAAMRALPPAGDEDETALIGMSALLTPPEFEDLLSNIRAGVYPTRITLTTEESEKFKFGNDPSGNELEWDNLITPATVPVASVEFEYEFHEVTRDPEANPYKSLRDLSGVNFEDRREVARATLERIDELRSTVRTGLWVFVAMMVLLLIALAKW